jgi:hypothetical protein
MVLIFQLQSDERIQVQETLNKDELKEPNNKKPTEK